MGISDHINAFTNLGKFLYQFSSAGFLENNEVSGLNKLFRKRFENCIKLAEIHNPWFTEEFIRSALYAISASITEEKIRRWLANYPDLAEKINKPKKIGIVMAGNIPLAGFHDMITTLMSGNIMFGKMSSKDKQLFPLIKDILCNINPEYDQRIRLTEETLHNMDAIVATGSNNSFRYFEYYFRSYPHILRKNRNSVAIIRGTESNEALKKLSNDIFLYFGLGCRNVSKVFLPVNYDPSELLSSFEAYSYLCNHNKYCNNYQYHKAIFLVNKVSHLDTGFLLFKEDLNYSSPVGVVYYEYYSSAEMLEKKLANDKELLQCIVESENSFPGRIPFGESQHPELWEYADNVDTLKFFLNLKYK